MDERLGLYTLCDKNTAWTQCGKVVDLWCEIMDDSVSDTIAYRFRELFWGLLLVEHSKGKKVVLNNLDGIAYHGVWTPLCFTGIKPDNFSNNYHGAPLKRVTLYPSGRIKVDFKDNRPSEWIEVDDVSMNPRPKADMEVGWTKCKLVRDLWSGVIDTSRTSEEQLTRFKELFLGILLFQYSKGKALPTYRPENYKGVWTPLWFAGIPPTFFCGEHNGKHLRRITLYPDGKIKVAYVGDEPEEWI